jgi:hypothetical protein
MDRQIDRSTHRQTDSRIHGPYYPNSGLPLYFYDCHFICIMPPLNCCLVTQIQSCHFISTTATLFELCHPRIFALLPKFSAAALFQRLPLYLNYATPAFLPYCPNSGRPLYFNDCHFIGTMPPRFFVLLPKCRAATLFRRLPLYLNYATRDLLP